MLDFNDLERVLERRWPSTAYEDSLVMDFDAEVWRTLHSLMSPQGDSFIVPSLLGLWCTDGAFEKHENGASPHNRTLLHDVVKSVRVREQIKVLEG